MTMFNSAVIFDLDGVIIDTDPLYTKAEVRLFKEYNVVFAVYNGKHTSKYMKLEY